MDKKVKYLYAGLVVLFCFGFMSASLVEAKGTKDWPNWRGPNLDGTFQADVFKGDFGLKIGWKKEMGSGYSSISIADGHVVTMFSDSTWDYVVSFDANSGAEQWRFKIDSTYVGHTGSHNGPISTPVIDGDRVYALGPRGQFFALNLNDGKMVWSTNLPEDHNAVVPFYGFTTAPLVYKDHVIIETGGSNSNTISALNKNNGEVVWTAGDDTVNYQSPMMFEFDNETHLVCSGDKFMCGFSPETGKLLWKYDHNTRVQSINPVYLQDGKLFFGTRGRQSEAIELTRNGEMFDAKQIWTSRDLRGTFNPTALQDGVLYGYSGRFLAAIDAVTGERVWKSRPPGNGWVIVVDDHLVALTQAGTMHVSKANREGFEELASLQVFGQLAWTPPSFANGRIFARSLTEIAAIDIVPKSQVIAADLPAAPDVAQAEGLAPEGSQFAKFLKKVEASSDKKAAVDKYMSAQKSFPIIEGKKYAHIVYHGDAKDVALSGDPLEWNVEQQLHPVPGTDLSYYTLELVPDARVNYRINVDLTTPGPDPMNKTAPVFSVFGPSSELAMPDWKRPAHLAEPTGMARGKVDSMSFESKILNNTRLIDVYTPVGYDKGNNRYATVYVNYGRPAQQNGLMLNTLDNIIGKSIEPVIVVFIDAPNSGQEYARQGRDQYAQMVVEEIVPMIDAKYRTKADSKFRAFIGGDEGGYAAIYTTFKHPGVFSKIGGQSTHLLGNGNGGDELWALLKSSPKLDVKVHLEWAKYEYRNTQQQFDWRQMNMQLADWFKENGYALTTAETNQGWGWASWRNRTDKVLEAFFPLHN